MLYAKTLSDSTTTIGQAKGWFLDSPDSQQIVIAEKNRLTLMDDKCNIISSLYSYKTIDTISTVWGFEGFNDLLFWLSTDLSFGLLTFSENTVRTIHEGHIIDYVGCDFPFRVSRRQLLVTGKGGERTIFASVFEASDRSNFYPLLVFKITNVVTERVTTGSQLFVNIDVSIANIPLPRPVSNFIDFAEVGNRGACPKLALLLRHHEECSAFSFIFGQKSLELDDIQCSSVPNDSMLVKAVDDNVWVIAPSGIVCLGQHNKCFKVAQASGRPMSTCSIKGDGLLLIAYEDGSIWAVQSDMCSRVGWSSTTVRLPHAHFLTYLRVSGILLLGSRTSNSVAVRLSRCPQSRIKMSLFKERVKANNGPVVAAKVMRSTGYERDLIVTANSTASDGSINIGHVGLAIESTYERRTFPGTCEIFSADNYLLLTTNSSSTIKEVISSSPFIINQRPSPSPHKTLYFGKIGCNIVQVTLTKCFLLDHNLNVLDILNNYEGLIEAKVCGDKHLLLLRYIDHVVTFSVSNDKWSQFDRLNQSVQAATVSNTRIIYADRSNVIRLGASTYNMTSAVKQMIVKNNNVLMAMEDGSIQIRGEYSYSSIPCDAEVKIYDMDTYILITCDGRPYIWDPKIQTIRPIACSREIYSATLFDIPNIPNTLSKIPTRTYPSFYAIYVDSWHSLELTRVKCEVSVDWRHQFVGGTPVLLEVHADIIAVLVETKDSLEIKLYDPALSLIDSMSFSRATKPIALISVPYPERTFFALVSNDARYKSQVMLFEVSDDSIILVCSYPLRNAYAASKGREGEIIAACENEIVIIKIIEELSGKLYLQPIQNIPFDEPMVFSAISSECKTSLCSYQAEACDIYNREGANLVVLVKFASSSWFMKVVDGKWVLINPKNSSTACPHPVTAVAYPPQMMWASSWSRDLTCIDCSNDELKPIASCRLRHMVMFMSHFNPRITDEDRSVKTDLLCISTSGALVLLTPLPSKSHFFLLKQVQGALDKTFQLQAYSQFTVGNWPHKECFSGKNILDADFIEEFERLETNIRENITKSVNAKTELILKCLADVDQMIV